MRDLPEMKVGVRRDEGREFPAATRNLRQIAQLMGERLMLPSEFPKELKVDISLDSLKEPHWMRPELFESVCRLSNSGARVGATHYLFVVPNSIAGRPLTVNNILAVANEILPPEKPLFHRYDQSGSHKWFEASPFSDLVLVEEPRWALVYQEPWRVGRRELLHPVPDYQRAGVGEVLICAFANLLLRDRRIFDDSYGTCLECIDRDQRVDIGLNQKSGLRIWYDDMDPERDKLIGHALSRH